MARYLKLEWGVLVRVSDPMTLRLWSTGCVQRLPRMPLSNPPPPPFLASIPNACNSPLHQSFHLIPR